ncbi:RanGTP-binding protein-domain-containing protein [Lineolata rhizophorae]|uniref:RanGTP-binding protein-domain-containing protein n=1 Tax=Lineolata rhizophorae TaxID=578093 RepID=A0A6A6NQX7_9PEZI|nr:RanGTP-binding protein-domain-containing protein [Lineolata rhizophorae]
MDVLLNKFTQQAMNYAIRSGITITSGYAIRQCSRLLKSVEGNDKEELAALQLRLESKIRLIILISPSAARGNTSLESAVTLTKNIRWDIQNLGVRLARAVSDEQLQRKGRLNNRSITQRDLELKLIIADIKKLLTRIEDAVPLINLAITTSGVNLSTTLPSSVSPSRLLQASTFLTAGDTQYSMEPAAGSVQIGPPFVLSMYMLFSGHAFRPHEDETIRETTWKEVIHKAKVKLIRVPLDKLNDGAPENDENYGPNSVPSEGKAYEFAYQLLIIEDLEDDRVHTFDDEDQPQPGSFEDVALAGIREIIPIHEISKIFYADTGKILNIGADGETNNPVLLFKRDVNAIPPRRMMEQQNLEETDWYDEHPEEWDAEDEEGDNTPSDHEEDDDAAAIEAQFRRESSIPLPPDDAQPPENTPHHDPWRLPPDLDPEWIAFEVYVEDPDSDSELDANEPSPSSVAANIPSPPSQPSSSRAGSREQTSTLASAFAHLRINPFSPHSSPPAVTPSPTSSPQPRPSSPSPDTQLATSTNTNLSASTPNTIAPTLPPLRTSLSLLELLVRLTALQQFQQSSHLAITDELLNFFLAESATVGAGADADLRRRVRAHARRKVGFDPYDESPIKRRGEDGAAGPGTRSPRGPRDIDLDHDHDPDPGDHDAYYFDPHDGGFPGSSSGSGGGSSRRASIRRGGDTAGVRRGDHRGEQGPAGGVEAGAAAEESVGEDGRG